MKNPNPLRILVQLVFHFRRGVPFSLFLLLELEFDRTTDKNEKKK